MPDTPTLLWFRKDLRLADNAALAAAIEMGGPIIPVFIWSPEEAEAWAPGAASKWWLHQALQSLGDAWREQGGTLVLRAGDSLAELRALIAATGAGRVLWNRRYESPLREKDIEIKRLLRADGIEVASFNSSLMNEPHTVATGAGKPYKVYTPYWNKVKDRHFEDPVEPALERLRFPDAYPRSESLDALCLLPDLAWHGKLAKHWEVSEADAARRFEQFLRQSIDDYAVARDIPSETGTSGLSPYLHWGLIGPRQIVRGIRGAGLHSAGSEVYLKEIYWREFAYHVLYHFPHTANAPLHAKYADFPWQPDPEILSRWQRGQTGYPIVDAGMRQLYATGWMHNRVRMIVASFLVKHLLQTWEAGAAWFWDTLVDADLASNTLGWQWSAGCGADAAPYFRVFNPILQGQKFDPEGAYVREWVPEIAALPKRWVHQPWELPEAMQARLCVKIGRDYPAPIVEHAFGRERALAALNQFKNLG